MIQVATSSASASRICTGCREEKPFSEYPKLVRGPQGLSRRCKECMREWAREYKKRTQAPREISQMELARLDRDAESDYRVCASCGQRHSLESFRAREGRNDFTLRCLECRTATRSSSDYWLWSMYRLRRVNYDEMLEAQHGVCAICAQTSRRGYLVVDHDHACCPGKKSCGACVRGLLCDGCNQKLPLLEKYGDIALKYLKERSVT